MSAAPCIAFFNNKGGVGKTSLVYHLAWMYADLGLRVIAADLDPQANLTAAFLDEDRLEELWEDGKSRTTVFGAVQPLLRGIGDIASPHLELLDDSIGLLVGDLSLSRFEDPLSEVWPKCNDRDERAFRVMSALWRIIQESVGAHVADIALVDLGPNLGALNRAALISADHVVVPLSPDLFSLQGLRNLGPTLRDWKSGWEERLTKRPKGGDLPLPTGRMQSAGYIVLQHSIRGDRPVKAYERWITRIPREYRNSVLQTSLNTDVTVAQDPHCLAILKHYRSLMPMAQEARKPMFHLKPADGAIGAHYQAVQSAFHDFEELARKVAEKTGVRVP